jgi:hypothetical protein
MKFTKTIRDTSVQFELDEENEENISVKITIPPYGHWKRGNQYLIAELNQIVLQEVDKNLMPIRVEGRCKAHRDETRLICLEFKKPALKKKIEKAASSKETVVRDVASDTSEKSNAKFSSEKSTRTKGTRAKKR